MKRFRDVNDTNELSAFCYSLWCISRFAREKYKDAYERKRKLESISDNKPAEFTPEQQKELRKLRQKLCNAQSSKRVNGVIIPNEMVKDNECQYCKSAVVWRKCHKSRKDK